MRVGLVGWRGMVGSVLMERMESEGDFEVIDATFFTTSQLGQPAPRGSHILEDAFDLDVLLAQEVILTCQGSDYTKEVHPKLRAAGWDGAWIDASSALRLEPDSIIVLDPVNRAKIEEGLERGVRDFVGGNCTVSLMLMAVGSLFKQGWLEWLHSSTYQAASGAGAKALRELAEQLHHLGEGIADLLADPAQGVLDIDRKLAEVQRGDGLPTAELGHPLAGSLLPWIDRPVEHGQSREEWKGIAETNRILGLDPPVPIDGVCVRIGAMRCHSQSLLIKLNRDIPLAEIEAVLRDSHPWIEVVENTPEASLAQLTPAAVTGSLRVPVGRLRKTHHGPEYLSCFTVGDQLLWGAAEPLRRVLRILVGRDVAVSV